jgi:hypothetical protein
MADKLTSLCELQLYSILQEIGSSGVETTSAATRALAHCRGLENMLAAAALKDEADASLAAVTKEINNVIINLQFHDELAQRVGHVLQLFSILKRNMQPKANESRSEEEFLRIASRIFSMQSEFAVLQQLFPGCNHVSCSADTELF